MVSGDFLLSNSFLLDMLKKKNMQCNDDEIETLTLSNDVSEMVMETKEILEEIVLIKNRLDLIENRICMRT